MEGLEAALVAIWIDRNCRRAKGLEDKLLAKMSLSGSDAIPVTQQ